MSSTLSLSVKPTFLIRTLNESDSLGYRALRKRILNSKDAAYFSDSYERERQLSESQWLEWCKEKPEHCILGTFADDQLIGIIMVTRQGGHNSPIVEWEAAWLDPRYRGTGVGKLAYEQAREWSKAQGYKFVVGFIRATYTPALNICRNQGFVYAYSVRDELWADGSVADIHAYLLDLRSEASQFASMPVCDRFKEALPFLSEGYHAPSRQDISQVA